ncbi:GapA-binding peptide SR1P [Paenibacillus assamensis]|uniref:GapA-binding peptide SR1P n=1 Tax=Paenibacillus assamensis TaxID=311244 RepID=UPI000407C7C0|nr:GapA-binding peptide SR1P [Paenibacillus assamensis]
MNDSMNNLNVNMGVIICKHCNSQVETLNTNRMVVYYGVCDQPECRQLHRSLDVPINMYAE